MFYCYYYFFIILYITPALLLMPDSFNSLSLPKNNTYCFILRSRRRPGADARLWLCWRVFTWISRLVQQLFFFPRVFAFHLFAYFPWHGHCIWLALNEFGRPGDIRQSWFNTVWMIYFLNFLVVVRTKSMSCCSLLKLTKIIMQEWLWMKERINIKPE